MSITSESLTSANKKAIWSDNTITDLILDVCYTQVAAIDFTKNVDKSRFCYQICLEHVSLK